VTVKENRKVCNTKPENDYVISSMHVIAFVQAKCLFTDHRHLIGIRGLKL